MYQVELTKEELYWLHIRVDAAMSHAEEFAEIEPYYMHELRMLTDLMAKLHPLLQAATGGK